MKKFISLFIIVLIAFGAYTYFSQPIKGDDEGGVTVVLLDKSGAEISSDSYDFNNQQSLYDLVKNNYQIACASSSYQVDETCSFISLESHILLKINELDTNWSGSYIQIFVNGIPSEYGIDQVMLTDNSIYVFKYVDLGGGN